MKIFHINTNKRNIIYIDKKAINDLLSLEENKKILAIGMINRYNEKRELSP